VGIAIPDVSRHCLRRDLIFDAALSIMTVAT
jgi:hypothetical protein